MHYAYVIVIYHLTIYTYEEIKNTWSTYFQIELQAKKKTQSKFKFKQSDGGKKRKWKMDSV